MSPAAARSFTCRSPIAFPIFDPFRSQNRSLFRMRSRSFYPSRRALGPTSAIMAFSVALPSRASFAKSFVGSFTMLTISFCRVNWMFPDRNGGRVFSTISITRCCSSSSSYASPRRLAAYDLGERALHAARADLQVLPLLLVRLQRALPRRHVGHFPLAHLPLVPPLLRLELLAVAQKHVVALGRLPVVLRLTSNLPRQTFS